MELVVRFPVEIVRHIFSFGSPELRAQKRKYLQQIITRLPKYLSFLLDHYPLQNYFYKVGPKQREGIFKTVRHCSCCARHLARRPIHANDARMYYFHNRDEEPECACACRYVMRRLARSADFEYE
jgi:hypothetical protein